MKKLLPVLFIAISAVLWGLIAIFVKNLSKAGFSPMEIVTIRVSTAALILFVGGIIRNRKQLAIKLIDLKLFIGTGICSIVFFNWCYFTTINQMSLSIAVILLYTAPAFVTVLSFFFLKEKLTLLKIVSVIGTLLGCVLIAGINQNAASQVHVMGLIIGLGAGFGYALYSIFGKVALRKYESFTVTFYTFLTATVVLIPSTGLWDKWSILRGDVLLWGIGLGLIPTVFAYFLYTIGLEKIESSKASIIATVEPVVATLLSVLYYDEKLGIMQLIGSALVVISVSLINLPIRKRNLLKNTNVPIN